MLKLTDLFDLSCIIEAHKILNNDYPECLLKTVQLSNRARNAERLMVQTNFTYTPKQFSTNLSAAWNKTDFHIKRVTN